MNDSVLKREQRKSELVDRLRERSKKARESQGVAYESLIAAVEGGDSLAAPLSQVASGKLDFGKERFSVLTKLIEAVTEREDLSTLSALEGQKDLAPVATAVRKAIREIDYTHYGSQVQE